MRTHDASIGDHPKCAREGGSGAAVVGVVGAAAAVGLTHLELMHKQGGGGEGTGGKEEEGDEVGGQGNSAPCLESTGPATSNARQQLQQQQQPQQHVQPEQQQSPPPQQQKHELQEAEGAKGEKEVGESCNTSSMDDAKVQQQAQQQQQQQLESFERNKVWLGEGGGEEGRVAVVGRRDPNARNKIRGRSINTNRNRISTSFKMISTSSTCSSGGSTRSTTTSNSSSNRNNNGVLTVALVMALVAYCPLANG